MLHRSRLIAFLLMALVLVACQPAPAPTATPVAIATVQPTETPLPPSATPLPTEEATEEPTPVPTEAEVEEASEEMAAFLTPLGTYATGILEASGAEIVAYDPGSQRIFSTNAANNTLDILDASDPTNPSLILSVSMSEYGAGINSAAVKNGIVAAAVEAEETDGNGQIVFLDTDGAVVAAVEAGVLPDMVTFTPDGSKVLTANEGEPSDDYTIDPEGSVTIVDLSGGIESLTQDNVTQVTFTQFNDAELDPAIRIYGPNATVAQDLEPEYIAISSDGSTAYVSLQENNALAVVDIAAAEVTALVALGFKDHSIEGAGLDASDRDGGINIRTWPVLGMYLPDTIAAYTVDGATYVVSANEGDARAYAGFDEEARVADLTLDPDAYPNAEELQAEENLGRLRTSTVMGDVDGDGDVDQIYSYGARSFTIWDSAGSLVWDSGDQFEQIVAQRIPDFFNAQGGGDFDSRSDDKGGEPEALTVGVIDGRTYAFVGLERQSAIFVYDITDPLAPSFVDLVTNWNPEGSMEDGSAGDVSPEGMVFIPAEDSPNGQPLLVVANEFSGTVTLWAVNP
jgi:hypothetical protein